MCCRAVRLYAQDGPTEARIDKDTGIFEWIVPWDASKYGTRSGGRKFNQYQHAKGEHHVAGGGTSTHPSTVKAAAASARLVSSRTANDLNA